MDFYLDLQDKRINHVKILLDKKRLHTHNIKDFKTANKTNEDFFVYPPSKKWTKEEINSLPNDVTIYCGNISNEFQKLLQEKNITHKNFLDDEHLTVENAKLTAEGVLAILISNTPRSIYENKILLLGAGRITKSCAVLFAKLGLNFSIATFNAQEFESTFYFAKENFFGFDFVKKLNEFDVIINTRPLKFIDENIIAQIKKEALFVETASVNCLDKEKVTNFDYIPSPALPSKYSSESAGKLIFNKIMGDLKL